MKRDVGGYMTVEASLVFPLMLFLIVFVIYVAFFRYDICVVSQNMEIAGIKGSLMNGDTNEERYSQMWEEDMIPLEQRLVSMGTLEKDMEIQGDDIRIQAEGSLNVAFYKNLSWSISESVEKKKHNPVLFIRNARKVEKMIAGNIQD